MGAAETLSIPEPDLEALEAIFPLFPIQPSISKEGRSSKGSQRSKLIRGGSKQLLLERRNSGGENTSSRRLSAQLGEQTTADGVPLRRIARRSCAAELMGSKERPINHG